jgi:hypothetical protein
MGGVSDMPTCKINAAGQITLTEDLLAHLGVRPGSGVEIAKAEHASLVMSAAAAEHSIAQVFGCLKRKDARPLSIEELNEAISQGWAGES